MAVTRAWSGVRPLRVVIRPHPAESRSWQDLVPADLADRVMLAGGIGKDVILAAADVALGLNSMLLAEAADAGIETYAAYPTGCYTGPKLSDYRSNIGLLAEGVQFAGDLTARLMRSATFESRTEPHA
jgi:hypothetical protein